GASWLTGMIGGRRPAERLSVADPWRSPHVFVRRSGGCPTEYTQGGVTRRYGGAPTPLEGLRRRGIVGRIPATRKGKAMCDRDHYEEDMKRYRRNVTRREFHAVTAGGGPPTQRRARVHAPPPPAAVGQRR